MRQALAILAAALLAVLGAVVLGEYDLRGVTVVIGFPLYGLAVAEVALGVGRHLSPGALLAVAGVAAAGLTWALWISFGHFRNGAMPPVLSWVMVAAAAAATLGWCWSGRRRHQGDRVARTAPGAGLP